MKRGNDRTPRAVRMFVLARTLARTRSGVGIKEFATQHNWPWRSIYRLKKDLEEAGLRIDEPERGRFRLAEGEISTWLDGGASPDEILALFVTRRWLASLRVTSMGRALDSLWRRLTERGGQALLLPTDQNRLSVRPAAAIDYEPHRDTLAVIEQAVAEQRCLRCRYRRPGSRDVTERVIEPGFLHLDLAVDGAYLVGWCRLRQDVRYFAVHRFQSVELTDDHVQNRPELSASIQQRAFRLWWRNRVQYVRIRFSAAVADEIRERRWHPSQSIQDQPDGAVILGMDVSAPEELERWLLGFAEDAEVLEPASLAEQIRQRHAAAIASLFPGVQDASRARSLPPAIARTLSRDGNGSAQSGSPSTRSGVRKRLR